MKKSFFISGLLLCIFFATTYAQTKIVKGGVPGLLFKTLNISYEQATTENQSFQIKAGYTIPRRIPFYDSSSNGTNSQEKFSGFAFVPEYRFYVVSQEALRGFYVAPYLKLDRYALEYIDNVDGVISSVTGTYGTVGAGVQLGAQWLINDQFAIDLGLFGFGLGRNLLSLEYRSDEPNTDLVEFARDVEEVTKDWVFFGKRIDIELGEDFVKVKAPFLFPGFRFNFSMGYAF